MKVRILIPHETVDIFLADMNLEDIQALLHVLDPDRNHEARRTLYDQLQRAKAILDKNPYLKIGE